MEVRCLSFNQIYLYDLWSMLLRSAFWFVLIIWINFCLCSSIIWKWQEQTNSKTNINLFYNSWWIFNSKRIKIQKCWCAHELCECVWNSLLEYLLSDNNYNEHYIYFVYCKCMNVCFKWNDLLKWQRKKELK